MLMSFFISLSTGYTVELIGAPESPLPSLPRPLQSSCSQTWCPTDLLTSDMHPRLKLGRLGFCILFTFKSSVKSKEVLSVLVIWVTDSVEHRYEQTYIYSKVLDIINEIVYPSNCKIFGEKPWYIETSLPVYPLTFHYMVYWGSTGCISTTTSFFPHGHPDNYSSFKQNPREKMFDCRDALCNKES